MHFIEHIVCALAVAALFKFVHRQQFERVAHALPIRPGVITCVNRLRRAGFMVGVVSDSYFVAAEILRRRIFADFALAHTLQFQSDVCGGTVRLNPAFLPRETDETREGGELAGRDAAAGFVNLLRRGIGPDELFPTCFEEWRRTAVADGVSGVRIERALGAVRVIPHRADHLHVVVADEAARLADRLRERLAAAPLLLADGRQVAVTFSIGLADASAGTLEEGLAQADRALYAAKERGRSCTVVAEPRRLQP